MSWSENEEQQLSMLLQENPRPILAQIGQRLGKSRSAIAGKIARLRGARRKDPPRSLDIVFDGPLANEGPRFIEIENAAGKSVKAGKWIQRDDGLWVIRLKRSDFHA